jgi:formiminotetrahydrofolate cyclodeaminase
MLDNSLMDFSRQLSTKAPVPGGGGTSAYVGALGIALGSMVGNLTLGKKKYEGVQDEIKELLTKSEELRDKLQRLVEKDAEVFYPLSQAYGLPKATEEEKQKRDEVMQRCLRDASMVPLEIAENALEAIKLHERYAQIGTRIAISDVGVGVAFCMAALKGAKLNVLINTRLMKNAELKNEIENRLYAAEKDGLAIGESTLKYVEGLLK